MANQYHSKTQTLETCPQISDQDFNLFHSIDRELYARLVQNLGRTPTESGRAMAFWMWLERECNDMKLIKRLLSLPPFLLTELADETRACLTCLESDTFHYNADITLLPGILNCPVFSLRFFHENRNAVLQSVTKIINTVCIRAFRDIPAMAPFVNLDHPARGLVRMPPRMGGFPAFGMAAQRHVALGSDFGEMNVYREEEYVGPRDNFPIDDRTIFLTFSKGYPTAEDEIKGYFTRRFGDFIEDLIFQEVGNEEQVLYARMVVKSVAIGVIDVIVGRENKAKYTINGKHVWARKYVRKSRSPPRGGRSL